MDVAFTACDSPPGTSGCHRRATRRCGLRGWRNLAPALAAFSRGKCVILTTSDPSGDLGLSVDVHASGVLEKPFDLDTLATLVAEVFNRHPDSRRPRLARGP